MSATSMIDEAADDLLGLVERAVDDDGAVRAVLHAGRGLDTEQLGAAVGDDGGVLLEPLVDLACRSAFMTSGSTLGVEVGAGGEHQDVLHGSGLSRAAPGGAWSPTRRRPSVGNRQLVRESLRRLSARGQHLLAQDVAVAGVPAPAPRPCARRSSAGSAARAGCARPGRRGRTAPRSRPPRPRPPGSRPAPTPTVSPSSSTQLSSPLSGMPDLRAAAPGQRDVEPHPLHERAVLDDAQQRRRRRHQPGPRLLLAQPLEQRHHLGAVVVHERQQLGALAADEGVLAEVGCRRLRSRATSLGGATVWPSDGRGVGAPWRLAGRNVAGGPTAPDRRRA